MACTKILFSWQMAEIYGPHPLLHAFNNGFVPVFCAEDQMNGVLSIAMRQRDFLRGSILSVAAPLALNFYSLRTHRSRGGLTSGRA